MIYPAELIQRKRDGEELASGEIAELVLGYARGEIPDYQLAAFCMAVFFRGLSPRETFALTEAFSSRRALSRVRFKTKPAPELLEREESTQNSPSNKARNSTAEISLSSAARHNCRALSTALR